MTVPTDRSTARRTFIHSSGRFDRSDASVKASSRSLRKKGCLITHTELSNVKLSVFDADPNWGLAEGVGSGRSEYIIEYDKRVLKRLQDPSGHRLSTLVYQAVGGHWRNPFYAISCPFEDLETGKRFMVLLTHAPLDNTKKRARVWIACAKGWVNLANRMRTINPGYGIYGVGDWNKNYRDAHERSMIERYMAAPAGLKQSWAGKTADDHGGSHGRRQLIDGALTDLKVIDCDLLTDDASSDHRPVGITVELVGAGPNVVLPPRPPLPPMPGKPPHPPAGDDAPVIHPWARRSRRWKRRHRVLWRQIVRWRRRNPR